MLVFDEELSGTGPFYTSQELNERLGRYDQISMQAVADHVAFAGTLTVALQHSADGRNFMSKNGTPEISSVTLATGITNVMSGSDSSPGPTLGYVRLCVLLTPPTNRVHVKVYVTLRDQSGASA